MSFFLVAAVLGGIGLLAMALLGLGARGGHGGQSGQGSHAGHAHGAGHHGATASARVGGITGATKAAALETGVASFGWLFALLSPRVLFSVCFGFGVSGLLAERFVGFPLALACAVAGGIAFEALLVGPLWRLLLRFSAPAKTLDHSLFATARAVTSFDKDGHGLVSVEVDGQLVQLLARLDRETARDARSSGVRVHVGDELLVEEIDDVRQRCRVSIR